MFSLRGSVNSRRIGRCSHCGGGVGWVWDEWKCINCGRAPWRGYTTGYARFARLQYEMYSVMQAGHRSRKTRY